MSIGRACVLCVFTSAHCRRFGVLDQFAAYHLTRAELITKALKVHAEQTVPCCV